MSEYPDVPPPGRSWWIGALWLLLIAGFITLMAWWVNRQRP